MTDAQKPIPGRNARLIVPPLVRAGEEFQVRILIQHPMETGFRRDVEGTLIEANLLESLALDFEGTPVFTARTLQALTANPFLVFVVAIKQSGRFNARWRDQRGNEGSISASVRVAGA
jgi:sulfur-oxidizing protein SoxZ